MDLCYLPPAGQTSHAIHLRQRIGQQAGEGAGKRRSTEEQTLPESQILWCVPRCQVICTARVLSSFCNTEHYSHGDQAVIVLHDARQSRHQAPRYHDGGQPDLRAELLEEEVGREFEEGVGEEEDRVGWRGVSGTGGGKAAGSGGSLTQIVAVAGELEVFLHPLYSGIANVPAALISETVAGL